MFTRPKEQEASIRQESLRLLAIIVSFAKGMNYDSSFIVLSGIFALITESPFIHSQKETKGRMNLSFPSTALNYSH